MLTAFDPKVTSALWSQESTSTGVVALLFKGRGEGCLVISAPVYAELPTYPGADKAFLDHCLETTVVQVQFVLVEATGQRAAFADDAARRRKVKEGSPSACS